jgi:cell shape-determining protein MreC
MAVEVLVSLIELDKDHFTNFQTRRAELQEQPQQLASKQTVTVNLEEAKRQKKDLPTVPWLSKSLPSAIVKNKDFLCSQRS